MKLPEIEYRQRGATQKVDPNLALQEQRANQSVMNGITELAGIAADLQADYEVDKQNIVATNELTSFRNENATKPFFSTVEAETLGVDVSGWKGDPDMVPSYMVYPHALKNKYDEVIATGLEGISMGTVQGDWNVAMRDMGAREQQQVVAHATKEMYENDTKVKMLDAEEAFGFGNRFGVTLAIDSMNVPAVEKKELQQIYDVRFEQQDDNRLIDTRNIDFIKQRSEYLRDDAYKGSYSPEERREQIARNDKAITTIEKQDALALKAQRESQVRTVWDDVQNTMAAGGVVNPSMVPAWFNPSERTALFSFIDKRGIIATNQDTWYELTRMAGSADHQKQFSELNLNEYRHLLSVGDFQSMAKLQNQITKDGTNSTTSLNLQAFQAQMDDAYRAAGMNPNIKPDNKKDRAQLKQQYELGRAVAAEVERQTLKDGPLNSQQRQQIIDDIFQPYITGNTKNTWWGLGAAEDIIFDVTLEDAAKVREATEVLIENNVPVTNETLNRAIYGPKGRTDEY